MADLEQLKQELEKLTKKVEELEKRGEEQESRYPKIGETFYFVEMGGEYGRIAEVSENVWDNDEVDEYYWNFCHGSTDEAKVEWTIKHIELINEIKKHTRPFLAGENNWHFEVAISSSKLIRTFHTRCYHANEYDFFASFEELEKVTEKFGEEYILNFLFRPADENYKAVMDWLVGQEENNVEPF